MKNVREIECDQFEVVTNNVMAGAQLTGRSKVK